MGGLLAFEKQDVVEEDGEVDGYHQALLSVPGNWSKLEANGAVWREAINRSVDVRLCVKTAH